MLASEPPATALRHFERRPLAAAFAVQLVQRLRDLDPKVRPVLRWLDERLAGQGTTADDMVHAEHQQQAAMSVTVRNIITSMRLTSAFDWAEFFESVSSVDKILRGDSRYAEMDFATRDTYRHAIEDLSRGTGLSEIDVTARVVDRARLAGVEPHASEQPERDRHTDPGYYLISQGRRAFEHELGYRVSWKRRLLRWYVRAPALGYLGSLAVLTAIVLAFPLWYAAGAGVTIAGLACPRSRGACAGLGSCHGAYQSYGDGHPRAAVITPDGIAERHSQRVPHDRGGPHIADEPAGHR